MSDLEKKEQETDLYDIDDDAARRLEVVWLNEIHKHSLLTPEEEVECGNDLKLIQDSIIVDSNNRFQLSNVLANLTESNASEILSGLQGMYTTIHERSLDKEESLLYKYLRKYHELGRVLNEEELQKMGITKDREIDEKTLLEQISNYIKYNVAKYKMIHANLGLVLPVANKYHNLFGTELIDLISEGNMGLMKAVDRFDVDRKCRFSTFATWWIRHNVIRYASNNCTPFSVGVNYWEKVKEFQKTVKELEEETNRKYSFSELAEMYHMDYNTVLDYMLYDTRATHLDQNIGDEDDSTIGDFIPGDDVDFEDSIYIQELRKALVEYIDHLSPGYRKVMMMLYGLNKEGRVYTVPEVCEKLGITKGSVEGRHRKALKIICSLVRRKGEKDKLQYFKTMN